MHCREKILLGLHEDGKWRLPGGKQDPNDDNGITKCPRFNAALREVTEETGLTLYDRLKLYYRFDREGYRTSMYTAQLDTQVKLKPRDKFSKWKWFKISEIDKIDLNIWDKIPLEKYAQDYRAAGSGQN